jgi:hypothetical protein
MGRLGFQRNQGSKSVTSYIRSIFNKPGAIIGIAAAGAFLVASGLNQGLRRTIELDGSIVLVVFVGGYFVWRRWGRNY